jgi:hypothetical protein
MTTPFASDIDPIDAFYQRANLLRSEFGYWDACDPIAHCILDLVEAQTEITHTIDDDVNYGVGGNAAIQAAVKTRAGAARKLMAMLNDRKTWPEVLR